MIEYRQLVMGAVGSNMGAIGGILKNQLALPGRSRSTRSRWPTARS
ncbi:MAG: hypothetical protein IPK00_16080 [Deltaproteobacteria bacterium]|nr:hypothetical protein [Deltaproteobacteria bacterium]